MEKLKVLQERKDGVLERMNAILDAAISEEREKTEERAWPPANAADTACNEACRRQALRNICTSRRS